MDARTFWLIGFALFGVIGGMLTFARRYKNPDADAGCGVAGWTVILRRKRKFLLSFSPSAVIIYPTPFANLMLLGILRAHTVVWARVALISQ
ncbi:MAG: hypothetical protein Greene07144_1119 [Parcubacteria group bacterium Greene0714_4]|nr:MAG: hypothetical protein Greene07144_1119 [Parcubacteria group bacterium Greene0714_4]